MISYNTLIVLLGASILGASAGLVGTFAVLRRRALTGDALSHAALPGICLAFLLTGEKRLPVLLLGALLSGLLGVLVIGALRRYSRIKEDAALGVVLSVFFGVGLVLNAYIQNTVPGGSKAGLSQYILGKTAGMILQDVYLIAGCALLCLVVVLLYYKEFKLIAFDSGFARVQGWPAARLDLLLMTLLAVTVMIGLPAVGAVLMAALIILPAATARLWTDKLHLVLIVSAALGAATGWVGTLLSAEYEKMPAGPIIILVGSGFFLASLLFAPRHGLVARLLARRNFNRELQRRRLLRILFETGDGAAAALPPQGFRSQGQLRGLLREAVADGLLTRTPEGRYRLTAAGLRRATAVVRGQRLWELFLTESPDVAASLANLAEESIDGVLTPEQVAELEAELRRQGRYPEATHLQ